MELIRVNTRELGRQDRMKHRDSSYNQSRRSIGDIEITRDKLILSKQVKDIAALMKKKSNSNSEQLSILKQAFIQNDENIDAFLSVTGALNVLIKELSGQDAMLQLAAAHCCCNLALGNAKLSSHVTKAAASYLTLHLQGANSALLDICAWTLGNLSASGSSSWDILSNQGTGSKLAHLLASENSEVVHSAIYALTHYLRAGEDKLSPQELHLICTRAIPLIRLYSDVYWLIFLLSCYGSCDEQLLSNNVMQSVMKLLSQDSIYVEHSTALLRIVGNLSSEQSGRAAQTLLYCPAEVLSIFSALLCLKQQHLKQEILWVLGNLCHHSSDNVRQKFAASGVLTALRPKLDVSASFQ